MHMHLFVLYIKKIKSHSGVLTEKQIYNVIHNLCRLIHQQVCHRIERYFNDEDALTNDPE